MRASPMLEFQVCEYESRIALLVENMKKAGMDGVMVTSMENTRYYTGLQSVIWPSKLSTPGLAIVSASGEVYAVGSASAKDTIYYTSCVDEGHAVHFSRNNIPGVPLTYPDAIYETIVKMGLDKGRLGIEIGGGTRLHLQMQWMDELRARLDKVEFVDAAPLIWAQRSVKTPAEIEVIRTLCDITDRCYQYAFEHVELGKTTEMGLYRLFAQEAFRCHCENVPPVGILFGKERYMNGNCPPSDDIVITNTPHAVLQIDGGPKYKGYVSDIIRIAVVQGLTPAQQKLVDAADDALEFALSKIRPGVNAKELCAKLDAHVAAGPAADYYRMYTWAGHGIGLDIHEVPVISTGCDMELQAGMVLAVEPVFGGPEIGVFGNEENILVTNNGCEILTKVSTRPFILQ